MRFGWEDYEKDKGLLATGWLFAGALAWVMLLAVGCSRPAIKPSQAPSRPSDIKVEVRDGGPIMVTDKRC